MKKILMGVAAMAMLFATGCSNDKLDLEKKYRSHEVTMELNMGVDSRTEMGENDCVWKVGDAIYAFSEDEKVWGVLKIMNQSDITNNGKTAKFTGTKNGKADLKHVVYPAKDADKDVRPGSFSVSVVDVEGDEGLKAPMVATIGTNTTFDYVGGLVKFQITGLEGKEVVFNAKLGNVDITGGIYQWENGGLVHYPEEGETTIHNLPEDGIVYLPVAVTTKAGVETTAPKATVTAYAQSNPENILGYIIGDAQGNGLEIPVSKGDISTNEVPNIEVTGNGKVSVGIVVATADELKDALNNPENGGKNIKLGCDIAMTLKLDVNNCILDGNNKKLTSDGRYILYPGTDGVTIRNLIIDGENERTGDGKAKYGMYNGSKTKYYSNGDIVLENVKSLGSAYAMNVYGKEGTQLLVSNSVLQGWTSYTGFDSAEFTGCHFTIGSYYDDPEDESWNKCFRPYRSVELISCTFDEGFYLDTDKIVEPETFVLKNCKVGKTLITSENLNVLLNVEGEVDKITIVNDVTEIKEN